VAEFRRILLKLSGESLGQEGDALNHERIDYFIREIATALQHGCELAVVVGGGNFFRGANSALALDRVAADQIGMLATMMNSIALREALRRHHLEAELFTAVEMQAIARRFEKGIVIDHGAGAQSLFFPVARGILFLQPIRRRFCGRSS
jgi:uridylate kinase